VTRQPVRLGALAAELGRTVEGDGEVEIRGVGALETAGPGDLVYVRSSRWAARLVDSAAGAVIAPDGLDVGGRPVIRSPNPGLDFARVARRLKGGDAAPPGVDPAASVDAGARIDPSASVGPGCALAAGVRVGARTRLHANVTLCRGVEVGADCAIHPGCVLREGTRVGDRVTLQPGVVLGGDGFGFVRDEQGRWVGLPQLGGVVIEDDVEIGANSTVDRGSLDDTRIGRGTKLDNLAQVGHNCQVGEDVSIGAQAALGGSVHVGSGAMVLPQAAVRDHASIGARAYVGPQSGVTGDVEAGRRVLGTPHTDVALTRRIWVAWRRLPEMLTRLRALERKVGLRGADGGGRRS
jgi:UDP-3-O-[3-hydroxymyristoyl] glucosamine N-acyltransferase